MDNIKDLPYISWLEESLQNVIKTDTKSICILTISESGDVGSGYWNCSNHDKILFAGFVQQDAMLDALRMDGYIDDECTEDAEDYTEDE